MKKLFGVIAAALVLCLCAAPAFASALATPEDIQVTITSPQSINSIPVHNDSIRITVANSGRKTYTDLACYLPIVDMGRGQTYPVDEFGENAYQTRTIKSLAPGQSASVAIPVRIMYTGNFHFLASVIDYQSNQTYNSQAINVTMTAASNLNKNLVMITAAILPILLAAATFFLSRGRTKSRA